MMEAADRELASAHLADAIDCAGGGGYETLSIYPPAASAPPTTWNGSALARIEVPAAILRPRCLDNDEVETWLEVVRSGLRDSIARRRAEINAENK